MKKTLLVIDAYISNLERAFVCERLIDQIRKVNPQIPILLLNKSGESFGVEKRTDYYYNHGESFMVGLPPQELLDSKEYSKPYVYLDTPYCTLENWMPLVNVTDHVANIYNSFIICSNFCNFLKFDNFLRVEFDIDFDLDDLSEIIKKIQNVQDHLIFGLRKEGIWMGPNQYLMDVHVSGFSSKVFDGFDLVSNDEEFWDVCRRIGYYGKWIEYIIPAIYRKNNVNNELFGEILETPIRQFYPQTKFDVVSSPGEWRNKWYEIPKLSSVVSESTNTQQKDKLGVFFYNADFDKINIKTKLYNKNNEIVFDRSLELNKNVWNFDVINFDGYIRMESIYTDSNGKEHVYTKEVTENFDTINCRMLMK